VDYEMEMHEIKGAIERINALLVLEENITIERQFNNFIDSKLPNNEKNSNQVLFNDFKTFLNDLDKVETDEMQYGAIVESKFLDKIISYKSNAREKELRRLTVELSDFIISIGHNFDKNHPKDYFATQLKSIANQITPKESKSSKESMNDAWKREMFLELVKRFK
jgi:hypothetical protein